MKNRYTLIFFSLLLFVCAVYLTGFRQTNTSTASDGYIKAVASQYHTNLDAFAQAVNQLDYLVKQLNQDPSFLAATRQQFYQVRLAYKRTEFLAAYLDGEFMKDYINGAPLSTLERNAPSESVLEAEGMQMLEEVLFADEVDHAHLAQLAQALQTNTGKMLNYHKKLVLTHRHIFEAARFYMIRVLTLGITGYDSPITLHSLPEAKAALEATHQALKVYYPALPQKNAALAKALEGYFQGANAYLEANNNFNTFDRMEFIKNYLNPLFKAIKDMHLGLGVETYYEAFNQHQKYSLNYYADNIFDEDFLNASYYQTTHSAKYNPQVIALGRMLFFDPALSSDNKRACAGCHVPEKAFTDGIAKSVAKDFKGTVKRNAPTLINAVYSDRFFYDLKVGSLEGQVDHVITNGKEFHTDFLQIMGKLSASDEYVALFKAAFPELTEEEPINKYSITASLSMYVRSLSGFNSPFDRYIRGESNQLSEPAIAGFNLFMGKAGCGTCHFAPVFNGLVPPEYHENESEVLGITANSDFTQPVLDNDMGRAHSGRLKENTDIYLRSFKTTTVRNSALTAPYMHNGAYTTLEQVVNFYNLGGGAGMGLAVPNQTLPPDPLGLTENEVTALVAFMETLTDTTGMQERPERLPAFSNNKALNNRKIGGDY